jgi:peptidoglycan hydrolase-like protein with peptidoglycan-binding domain
MAWSPIQLSGGKWGRLQLLFGSTDVTYFRQVPTTIETWENTDPFGDSELMLTFPQITVYDHLGVAPLAWLFNGQQVTLRLIRPNGTRKNLWEGYASMPQDAQGNGSMPLQVQCTGVLYQADQGRQKPRFAQDAEDIGKVISDAFNGYISRDYGPCTPVTTGILTRQRGSWTPIATGFVQDLLGTATTADGSNQWTVKQHGRLGPIIALKDISTVHATVTTGAQGVTPNLSSDTHGFFNVIYGEGTAPDGSRWRNTKYPNLRSDDAPIYPHSPGTVFNAGDGLTGFDPFADEMRRSGYHMASGDTYVSADVAEVRDAQARAGILVDGIVGPQTWASIFAVGSDGGDLSGAFFMPLAYDSRVEPYLYNAQGKKIGNNPAFEPGRPRIETKIDYGENISKADATRSARATLARFPAPGLAGEITLKSDPAEMSRFELRAGMNIKLKKYRGGDRMLHIAQVRVNWQDLTVTLTVDVYFRDLISLAAIKQRNREAASDPANRGSSQRRRSRIANDTIVVFDSESGAGIIPRHAVFGGLWTVLRIPAGQVGTIAKTRYTSTGPAAAFAVGVFSKPVTSNTLARLVGNPLGGSKPWSPEADALYDAGLLMAWGSIDEPAGYYPSTKTDGGAVTGRLIDDAGWEYVSEHPPWLWVAEFSGSSCFLEGRFFAAPDGG